MLNRTIIVVFFLLSSSAFALDLEREHLINIYHGVETDQSDQVNPAQSWVNISNGIKQNSLSDNGTTIKFSSLLEDEREPQTEVGFFSSKSLAEEVKKQDRYGLAADSEFKNPTTDDGYGVYIKQRF
mgnify:FL=1